MQKIKKGFTLAEVLVTMSIIGVVAALALPSMVNNIGTATFGPSVAKTVGLIESGMRNIIQSAADRAEKNQNDDSAESGFATNCIDLIEYKDLLGGNDSTRIITSHTMIEDLRGFFGANTVKDTEKAYLSDAKFYRGDTLISSSYSFIKDEKAYKFPGTNSIFVYEPRTDNSWTQINTVYDDAVFTRIIIDANGSDGPNRMGKDIFLFGLTEGGNVVPAGSYAYNHWTLSNRNEPLYTEACGDNIGNGVSCAARLAADNWKIKY